MIQQQILTDFTMGEISPRMLGRFDLPAYFKGAREITNMIPFFPGGTTYRPGFQYMGNPKNNATARLHPFIISKAYSYVLEFGNLYVRFWRDGNLIGAPTELVTPWGTGALWDLQFAQDENKLYIASGTAQVKVLEMTAADSFTLADLTITGISGSVPFQGAGNYPRCVAVHDGRLYLASSANEPNAIWASKPFEPGNFVYWDTIQYSSKQLREPMNQFTGTTASGSGTVSGIATDEIATLKTGDRVTGAGIIDKPRLTFVGTTTVGSNQITNVSSSAMAQLEAGETITGQSIPESTITNKSGTTVTISNNATAASTTNTMERAERRTYIDTIDTTSITLTIPATASATTELTAGWHDPVVPEYQTVTTTRDVVTSASAFKKEINDRIIWLCSGRDLVVGTVLGERVIPSGATSITFTCKQQTVISSAPIQPFMLNEAVIFIGSDEKAAHEYLYSQDTEAYMSPTLTALSDHILAAGVIEADYQNTPHPVAWFTLDDGTVAGCSYNKQYQLVAFFKITHASGTIESLAVVPGSGADVLYAIVNHEGHRTMERMSPLFGSEGHLDTWVAKTKTAGQATGVPAANEGAVTVVHDGVAYPITVTSGTATLPVEIPDGDQVLIGQQYTGKIRTMPSNAQARIGSAHMRSKTIPKLTAKLLASYPFKVGYDGGTMERARFTGPVSGDYPIPVMGSWDTEGSISIVQDQPFDLTVLAIAIEVDAGG